VGITSLTTVEIIPEDDPFYKYLGSTSSHTSYTNNPFDWEKTWYVWVFYLIFVCIFEYKLFGDKKKTIKN